MTDNNNMPCKKKDEGKNITYKEAQLNEWRIIEEIVMTYKGIEKGYNDYQEEEIIVVPLNSKEAANELIERFHPLMNKYIKLIKSGQINWSDMNIKKFVGTFIDDKGLKRALWRERQKPEYRNMIAQNFNFVVETAGQMPEEEMLLEFQIIILTLAKRYKKTNRNFCAYVNNCFFYEVSRWIKNYQKNPMNIHYRQVNFEDYIGIEEDFSIAIDDKFYENSMGIPDHNWIQGKSCSEMFKTLDNLERKIIIKYYLEDWNDKLISTEFSLHMNTINQKRNSAIKKIANHLGIDISKMKRNRNSGKQAVIV